MGRRTDDDKRQISRWTGVAGKASNHLNHSVLSLITFRASREKDCVGNAIVPLIAGFLTSHVSQFVVIEAMLTLANSASCCLVALEDDLMWIQMPLHPGLELEGAHSQYLSYLLSLVGKSR